MIDLTLYTATCIGNPENTYYPNRANIVDEQSLIQALKFDHITGKFKNNVRNNKNFLSSNTLVFDCDNDHSNNPKEWLTPLDVALEFVDVPFVAVYSRNNQKQKGQKVARPRFHIYFSVDSIDDYEEYSKMKHQIATIFPYFDKGAMDVARFIYGIQEPQIEVYQGTKSIEDFLEEKAFELFDSEPKKIEEGSRNSTMSAFAGKLIKRLGATKEAYDQFLKQAQKCVPPLESEELDKIWNSAGKFYKKVSSQDGYISPEMYNSECELRPEDFSDIGQAKSLYGKYQNELVYTDATDYMKYDGVRWVESKQLAVGACEDFLDLQLQEAELLVAKTHQSLFLLSKEQENSSRKSKSPEKEVDDETSKKMNEYQAALTYYKFVMKHRDVKYILSALQAAKPMFLKNISDFDSQAFYLNTPKATYNLENSAEKEHNASDLITKCTSVSPDEKGMNLWIDCLKSFFCDDEELIDFVKQVVGLTAVGKVYFESLIISYGEGRNGKSTFWNTISKVLGSYSGAISADVLTVGCKRNVKPEMAELKGKRLVIAAELEEGMRLNTSVVKQLCSTDEITAEKKYKDPFRFVPVHTVVLYTNHLPRVGAIDEGIWRRLTIIPFNAKIEGKSDIKNYSDYLFKNAGGAILSWIIEGAKEAIANAGKLVQPKIVQEAKERYRSSNDWLSIFIDDCCEVGASYQQKSGEFYQEYRAYCARTGEYTRSTTDFYAGLENAGYERKKSNTGAMIKGVRLKSEFMG